MQCRVHGVEINDTPKFLTNDLTYQNHYIMIGTKELDADNDNLILPLILKGVTSYLLVIPNLPTA